MLPSSVTVIENMPLTPNGKVDRRTLVARGQPIAGGAPLRPRTELERTIARIWRDILELDRPHPMLWLNADAPTERVRYLPFKAIATLFARQGAGPDHPVSLDCPEGEYLKAFLLQRSA